MEEEPGEDDTRVKVEEVEDQQSYSSSSSSKIIEDRSIGGRAALLKQNFSQETGQVPKSKFLPFLPKSTSLMKMEVSFKANYSFAILKMLEAVFENWLIFG